MTRATWIGLLVAAVVALPAEAEVARQIIWDDLIPAAEPLQDPFEELVGEPRDDLEEIALIRTLHMQGQISEVDPDFETSVELTHKLKKQGIDVDGMLARYDAFVAESRRRGESVVDALNGTLVRLPGYALPLEFSDSGVREFLLVPYVGACIHLPPPPPNQIVFVRLGKPFVVNDVFAPVWVTGRMSVQPTTRSLSLVDGSAAISSGYSIDGVSIEPYKE